MAPNGARLQPKVFHCTKKIKKYDDLSIDQFKFSSDHSGPSEESQLAFNFCQSVALIATRILIQ